MGPITNTTTLGQRRPGSNGNGEILQIPQNYQMLFSVISRTLIGKMQSAYSTAPADYVAIFNRKLRDFFKLRFLNKSLITLL